MTRVHQFVQCIDGSIVISRLAAERPDLAAAIVAEDVPPIQSGKPRAAINVASGDRAAFIVTVLDDRRFKSVRVAGPCPELVEGPSRAD